MDIWNVIRWILSVVFLCDGALFLWASTLFAIDVKRRPDLYATPAGRLSNTGVFAVFAGAGVACLALLFITVPL